MAKYNFIIILIFLFVFLAISSTKSSLTTIIYDQPNGYIVPEKYIPINGSRMSMLIYNESRILIVYYHWVIPQSSKFAITFLWMDYDGNILGNYTFYNSSWNWTTLCTRAITDGRYVYVVFITSTENGDDLLAVLKFDPYAGENGSVVDMFPIPTQIDDLHNETGIGDLVYYNGYLYLAGAVARTDGDYGGKGFLCCMDAQNGDILWYDIEENQSNIYEVTSHVHIEIYNDTLYLYGVWTPNMYVQGDLKLEARTLNGTLIWRKIWGSPNWDYSYEGNGGYVGAEHLLAIHNGYIYVGATVDMKLFNYTADNVSIYKFTLDGELVGEWKWSSNLADGASGIYVADNGTTYLLGYIYDYYEDSHTATMWILHPNSTSLKCYAYYDGKDARYMRIINGKIYLLGHHYLIIFSEDSDIIVAEFPPMIYILPILTITLAFKFRLEI